MVLLSHHGLIATHWSIARTFSSTAATAAVAFLLLSAAATAACALQWYYSCYQSGAEPTVCSAAAMAASADAYQRQFARGTPHASLLVLKLYSGQVFTHH
eukprot:18709-Heterococcus_DN1.PRE.3